MGYWHRRKMIPYGVSRTWCDEEDSLQTRTGAKVRHLSKVRARRVAKKAYRKKVQRQIEAIIYDTQISNRDNKNTIITVR